MRILIIGGGPAAVAAAAAAREQDATCSIAVFSAESLNPYRRPALPRMLGKDLPPEQFFLHDAKFYSDRRIEIRLGQYAVALDLGKHRVDFRNGSSERYDQLLIATGAECRRLDIPGVGLPGVMGIRTYADIKTLRNRLASGCRHAAVIGGGLLGLEITDGLIQAGCEVTVLEQAPRLLARQLDLAGSTYLAHQLHNNPHLKIRTGVDIYGFAGESRLEKILMNGHFPDQPCDLAVMSPGIVPNIDLALAGGLPTRRGIRVDSQLHAVGQSDIFVAGDCIDPADAPTGLVANAVAQGRIAGLNMTGQSNEYIPDISGIRLQALGVKLFAAGVVDQSSLKTETKFDAESGYWRRLYFQNETLVGVVLIGDLREAAALTGELNKKRQSGTPVI